MNVVADTNVVISAIFWAGESRQCLALWARRRFHLAITVPVFEEYAGVARRVAERITEVNPEPWLKWIERKAKVYEPAPICETHQVEFRWVKGHAGNLENERCDQLAMAALRQPNLPVDDGYQNKLETKGVRPNMQEGEPCRKCSTPVIKQRPRKKPKGDYYFEYYLYCPKCQTMYMVEEAKRLVEQPPSLF